MTSFHSSLNVDKIILRIGEPKSPNVLPKVSSIIFNDSSSNFRLISTINFSGSARISESFPSNNFAAFAGSLAIYSKLFSS